MATKYDIQAVQDRITSLKSRRSACVVRYEKFRYAELSDKMQECLEQIRYIDSEMKESLDHLEKLQYKTKELENILTQSIRNRNRLVKRLHYWQAKGNDAKCDEIYSQLWVENSNIEYCKDNLETA